MTPIPERFAANVAWLFTGLAWTARFAAARTAGFSAVEFPWPDDPAATVDAVRDAGLRVALLNAPAGDLAAGERGWPNDPARIAEFRRGLRSALDLAADVGCPTINVLAGNRLTTGPSVAEQEACLEANLRWALAEAKERGTHIVTELLNRQENPGYLLASLDEAQALLARLGPLGWALQLDTYHLGLTDPDVAGAIRRARGAIGHVQFADVPGRHRPGTGEIDWVAVEGALDEVGYDRFVGLEYVPLDDAGEPWEVSPAAPR